MKELHKIVSVDDAERFVLFIVRVLRELKGNDPTKWLNNDWYVAKLSHTLKKYPISEGLIRTKT